MTLFSDLKSFLDYFIIILILFAVSLLINAAILFARFKTREWGFAARHNVMHRILSEPETHSEQSPRQEGFLDECFWYMNWAPFAEEPEVRAHFEKKIQLLRGSMLPENEGKFELSETEEEIVECLKESEAYYKVIEEHPLRSWLLACVGLGPHWKLKMEQFRLGPCLSDLAWYVWERDFEVIEKKDVDGFEEDQYGWRDRNHLTSGKNSNSK